jgi:hypothetical protein
VVAVEHEFVYPLVCLATTMAKLLVVRLAAAHFLKYNRMNEVQQFKGQIFLIMQNPNSNISTLSYTLTPKVQHSIKQAYRNSLEASYRFPRYKIVNVILPERIVASI